MKNERSILPPPSNFLHPSSSVLLACFHSQGAQANWDFPFPEDATGVMPVSTADLRNGLCTSGATSVPVIELTILEAHDYFSRGALNCSTLVTAYLERIAALDKRTTLNAVFTINPAAISEAIRLDKMLNGNFFSFNSNNSIDKHEIISNLSSSYPLFCVPLLAKDNIDVSGMSNTAGSPALKQNYPLHDSRVIARFKSAGAIILGKSNLGELALFPSFCVSSLGGTVRNPYHLSHTPAGSSGGSAAGVAANFALAALGTDTGSSVRGPASHTGLIGLRPSFGLVPASGVVPLRFHRDTVGPITRSVRDAAIMLSVMQGFDPGDNRTHALLSTHFPPNYTQCLDPGGGLNGTRIGVMSDIVHLPGSDPDILSLFATALSDLEAAGAKLVDNFGITGNSLGKEWSADRDGEGPAVGHWHAAGAWQDLWACQWPLRVGIDEYLESHRNTQLVQNDTLPENLASIYQRQLYHPLAEREMHAAVTEPAQIPTAVENSTNEDLEGNDNNSPCRCGAIEEDPCRLEFRKNLVASMDRGQIDVLVYPSWNQPPMLIGQQSDYYDGNNSPFIAPHVGAPAITVPMGFTGTKLLQ